MLFLSALKSLIISLLWVRASLGAHVRQVKFCVRFGQVVVSSRDYPIFIIGSAQNLCN